MKEKGCLAAFQLFELQANTESEWKSKAQKQDNHLPFSMFSDKPAIVTYAGTGAPQKWPGQRHKAAV